MIPSLVSIILLLDHAGSVMLAAYAGIRAFWLSQAIEALQASRCDLKIAHFGADIKSTSSIAMERKRDEKESHQGKFVRRPRRRTSIVQKVRTNADGATRPVRHTNDRFDTQTIRFMKDRTDISWWIKLEPRKLEQANWFTDAILPLLEVRRITCLHSTASSSTKKRRLEELSIHDFSLLRRNNSQHSRSTTLSHTLSVRI